MMPPEQSLEPATAVAETASAAARLEAVLEPVAQTMGYEVLLVEWLSSGRSGILRVFLDGDDGVSIDDCARMSRIFSNALEVAESSDPSIARLLVDAYNLEVSSPGLERPLTRRGHFDRFLGQRARVRLRAPLQPEARQKSFTGIIDGTEPDPDRPDDDRAGTVTLREPDGGSLHRIPIPAIRRANLIYEG